MRLSILHFGVLALTSWLAAATALAQPKQINLHVSDFDVRNPPAVVAGQTKALFQARDFVKDTNNQAPTKLGADYFTINIKQPQQLGGGDVQAIEQVGNAGPLIPALIVATAMQEVDAAEADDAKLLAAWLTKQSRILDDMNQGAPVSILPDDETKKAWELFLDAWAQEAATKSKLRDELKAAPYEFVKAMAADVAGLNRKRRRRGPEWFQYNSSCKFRVIVRPSVARTSDESHCSSP